MPMIKCVCGEPLAGTDDDGLFAAIRAHADTVHADVGFRDEQIRDVIAARSRMSDWDGKRATLASPPEIRPITPERRDDWLRFFDRDAFMDNPMWADCYCMFYRFSGSNEEWEQRTATDNRNDQSEAIERGRSYFAYPPSPITIRETLKEVKRATQKGITINTFMLDRNYYLKEFVNQVAKINKGRVFYTTPDKLGQYILVDYVQNKRKNIKGQ